MEYYVHSNRMQQKRRFSFTRFLSGIFLLVFLFIAARTVGYKFFQKSGGVASPLSATLRQQTSSISLTEVEKQVTELIKKQRGSWSVYFVDFTNNQLFGINEQVIFRAASVNKLYTLASLYYLAGKGDVDLDETITLQQSDIADFGTGTIRYDPPGTVYSLKTLARLLMEKSDNSAENILESKIGTDKIQSIVNQFGMKQTSIVDNKTSLADVELLFEKIKHGEITDKAHTVEMIDFLDDSDYEDRLPAFLPKDVHVYHKIGNEVGNMHDVGMIEKDNTSYFLGVFSSDVGDAEDDAKKTIAQISKIVFDFKTSKQ